LAVTDEKDLSTAQSPAQADARVSRPDGYPGRTQHTQAPPGQGTQAAGSFDSSEAARLAPFAHSFSTAARLHHRHEYLRLQRIGARFQTTHFVLYAAIVSAGGESRLGITVSRRIGSAVVRNRVKRRVRECYRFELKHLVPNGAALVVIARDGAGRLRMPDVRAQLLKAVANLAGRLATE
jgi:ribonuclease P protein component